GHPLHPHGAGAGLHRRARRRPHGGKWQAPRADRRLPVRAVGRHHLRLRPRRRDRRLPRAPSPAARRPSPLRAPFPPLPRHFPPLSLVMSTFFVHEAPARSDSGSFGATWRAIRHALRERETWLVAGFIFFWTFSPSFGPAFLFYQTDTLGFDQQFIGHLGALS